MRGFFLCGLLVGLLSGCTGPAATVGATTSGVPKAAEVGSDFNLSPSQSAVVDGGALRVTFVKVSEDSRCPIGVQCVWAGDAATALILAPANGETTTPTLHTTLMPHAVASGAYEVTLVGVKPSPQQGSTIPQSSYIATFRIARQ